MGVLSSLLKGVMRNHVHFCAFSAVLIRCIVCIFFIMHTLFIVIFPIIFIFLIRRLRTIFHRPRSKKIILSPRINAGPGKVPLNRAKCEYS